MKDSKFEQFKEELSNLLIKEFKAKALRAESLKDIEFILKRTVSGILKTNPDGLFRLVLKYQHELNEDGPILVNKVKKNSFIFLTAPTMDEFITGSTIVSRSTKFQAKTSYVHLVGTAKAILHGESSGYVRDCAEVVLYDESEIYATDDARVTLHDNAKCKCNGRVTVEAYSKSQVVSNGFCKVGLSNKAYGILKHRSTAIVRSGAIAVLEQSSFALSLKGSVVFKDSPKAICEGDGYVVTRYEEKE